MKLSLWIMHCFAVDPSLTGDLTEEWATGHSSWWLLRQTIVACASALRSGLWNHKLRTVSAIIAGFVTVYVLNFAFWNVWMRATSGRGFIRGWPLFWAIAAGWVIGKLQPAQPLGTVFLFIATAVTISMSNGHPTHGPVALSLPVLLLSILSGSLMLLAVVFGGLLASRKAKSLPITG